MKKVKLNLGCASRLLSDYINIDLDSLEEIKKRYPNIVVPSDGVFVVGNALSLDFFDDSVDDIYSCKYVISFFSNQILAPVVADVESYTCIPLIKTAPAGALILS